MLHDLVYFFFTFAEVHDFYVCQNYVDPCRSALRSQTETHRSNSNGH